MKRYLALYDMKNASRGAALAKMLGEYGARVQNSAFELFLRDRAYGQMRERLVKIIDPEADKVRLYGLCHHCGESAELFGRAQKLTFPPDFLII